MPRVRTQQVVTLAHVILDTLVMASLVKILMNVNWLSLTVERTLCVRICQDLLTVRVRLVMRVTPKPSVMISMNVPRVATIVTSWQHVTTQKEVLRVHVTKALRVLEFNVKTQTNVRRDMPSATRWPTATTHLVGTLASVDLVMREQEKSVQISTNASLGHQIVTQHFREEQIVPTLPDHSTALAAADTKEMAGFAQILTNAK